MLKNFCLILLVLVVPVFAGGVFACVSSGDDDDDATASDDDLVVDDDDTTDDDTTDDDTDDDDTSDDDTADDDTTDDDTVDDDTSDDDLDLDLPDGVADLFDEDDLKAFLDAGGTINDGDAPPTIEGSYALDSLEVTVDPDGDEGNEAGGTILLTFSDQSSETINVDQAFLPPKAVQKEALAAFIAGDGS
ncbi:hypothetical protein KDL45_18655, partial [bacterium]|nr:hypothetical protein [bacterium]